MRITSHFSHTTFRLSPCFPCFPFTALGDGNFNVKNQLLLGTAQYDPAGNQTRMGDYTFTYDAENRLKTSTINGSTVTHYYDGEGRRVKRVGPGSRTVVYAYGVDGELAAEYDTEPSTVPGGVQYVAVDHLGSTRAVMDGAGSVTRLEDFLPFGETITAGIAGRGASYPGTAWAEVAGVSKRFTGKEREGEVGAGLDYFGARYFSGAQGRFTSSDAPFIDQRPEDPQSWNLYAYARNNPLAFIDPTGQYVCGTTMSKDECSHFRESLRQAQAGANKLKEKHGADSKQYLSVQRSIDAYGKADVDNGVTIQVGETGKFGAVTHVGGSTGPKTPDNPTGQNISVTFNTGMLANGSRPTLAVHEGMHIADGSLWVASGFSLSPTSYHGEFNAYRVSSWAGEGLGWAYQTLSAGAARYLLNVRGWGQSNTDNVINSILKNEYGLTPTDKRRLFHRVVRVIR